MKKIILILVTLTIASCSSVIAEEKAKSARSSAASSRINASDSNSDKIFKELE